MKKKVFGFLLTQLTALAASYSADFHTATVNTLKPIAEKYGVDFPGTALSLYDFEDCAADEFKWIITIEEGVLNLERELRVVRGRQEFRNKMDKMILNNRQRVYNALTRVLKAKQIKPCPPFPYTATAELARVNAAICYDYGDEFEEDF